MRNDPGFIRYPVMQIRPFGLLVYERVEFDRTPRKFAHTEAIRHLKEADPYSGYLTPAARKRLKRAISILCAIAEPKTAMNFKTNKEFKFRLNFITLTLPAPQGEITDKQIKAKVLDVWLKAARRRFKLRSYIWRAERQGNRNLHFHIVTDTYIPYDQLRDTWNDRLNALGFIDTFEAKHGHRHPNSTDVHAIKKVRDLAAYFAKYMAKGEKFYEDLFAQPPRKGKGVPAVHVNKKLKFKRVLTRAEAKIDGRLWDCSANLKIKGNCEMMLDGEAEQIFEAVREDAHVNRKDTDTCLMLFLNPRQFKKYIVGKPKECWDEWLKKFKIPPDV